MNTIHAIFALGGKPIKDDPAIIEGVVLNSDGSLPVKPADVGEAAWRSYLRSRDIHSTPQDHQRYHEKALEWGSRYDFNQALAREKALVEKNRLDDFLSAHPCDGASAPGDYSSLTDDTNRLHVETDSAKWKRVLAGLLALTVFLVYILLKIIEWLVS